MGEKNGDFEGGKQGESDFRLGEKWGGLEVVLRKRNLKYTNRGEK